MTGKGAGNKDGNRGTKIRFIMLEVDSADGNLSEITHAITNAVRPALTVQRTRAPLGALTAGEHPEAESHLEPQNLDESETVLEDETDAAGSRTSSKTPRKYPQPELLHDVDLTGGAVPFTTFALTKNPKKNSKRYLVVAAWFKEHGSREAITINHAYTCFRKVGWSTSIPDFDLPFRQLVKRDWMRRVQPGEYAITHLGEDEVAKMDAS